MEPQILLIFVALIALAGLGVWISWYLKQKRRQEMALAARQLGLEFSLTDPFGTLAEPFELLHKGDGRGIENVMWGTWQGIELRAFDYWYYEESTDSKGNRSRTYHRFDCALTPIEASCERLVIDRENLFTRLADALSFRDIELESEEFNRRFTIRSPDPKFATDFLDQRMMAWLLEHAGGFSFEVAGDRVLCWHKRMRPTEFTRLVGTTKLFLENVPRVVYDLYPKR